MFAHFREHIARAEQCIDIAIALSSRVCDDSRDLQASLSIMRLEVEQINHAALKASQRHDLEHAVTILETNNREILNFRRHETDGSGKKCREAIHAIDEAHHATTQLVDSIRSQFHH